MKRANRRIENRRAFRARAAAAHESGETEVFHGLIRRISDFYRFHRVCLRHTCGRHRRCADADLSCYRRDVDFWRREIFPRVRKGLARRVAAGPDDPGVQGAAEER
jgi:hypothetical protein